MEKENLYSFVMLLILVGMVVGVGVLALDKFGQATKESTVITNESFTVPNQNVKVSLANTDITSFSYILNASGDTWNSSQYVIDLAAGTLNNTGNSQECTNTSTCYAYYTYDEYDTVSATAINAGRDAVAEVSNTWMTLIVTIGILAVIIGLVVAGFALRKR